MNFKARVLENGIVQLIEPATIQGRDRFKIEDHGNLSHFPVGSIVNCKISHGSDSRIKFASILSSAENAPEGKVINFEMKKSIHNSYIESNEKPLHFYIVFNPLLNSEDKEVHPGQTQAHSFYNLLKDLVKNKNTPEQYLYWGKIKSTDVNEPLTQDVFKDVVRCNKGKNLPTHLYISDFSNLWCAKVDDIVFNLDKYEDRNHTLNFYQAHWDKVEVWFKIVDMCLLTNETSTTLESLSKLYISGCNQLNSKNANKKELQITPYLSNLRYPLVIADKSEEVYFDVNSAVKTAMAVNVLLEKSVSVTRDIKDKIHSYVIPECIFKLLSIQSQKEIISAELEFNSPKDFTAEEIFQKDLSVARKYLMVLEKSLKDVAKKCALHTCMTDMYLKDFYYLPESNLKTIKNSNPYLYTFFVNFKEKKDFSTFIKIRNSLIHLEYNSFDHSSIINIRREILGIGCQGLINSLYIAAYPELEKDFLVKEIKAA